MVTTARCHDFGIRHLPERERQTHEKPRTSLLFFWLTEVNTKSENNMSTVDFFSLSYPFCMVFHFVHFSAQCLWRLGQETLEEAAARTDGGRAGTRAAGLDGAHAGAPHGDTGAGVAGSRRAGAPSGPDQRLALRHAAFPGIVVPAPEEAGERLDSHRALQRPPSVRAAAYHRLSRPAADSVRPHALYPNTTGPLV